MRPAKIDVKLGTGGNVRWGNHSIRKGFLLMASRWSIQAACFMQKAIVFLSHSSHDKTVLVKLKELLDSKTAGVIEFFLSSDGQSIPFGRNWVAKIEESLRGAKLMFTFLTPEALDSTWVSFEAGFAYANGVQVVPVALPGLALREVPQPLSLLQGFDVKGHEGLNNLIQIINRTFGHTHQMTFRKEDFDDLFKATQIESENELAVYDNVVVYFELEGDHAGSGQSLGDVLIAAGLQPVRIESHAPNEETIVGPGVDVTIAHKGILPTKTTAGLPPKQIWRFSFMLHPRKLNVVATGVTKFLESKTLLGSVSVKFHFGEEIASENQTSKVLLQLEGTAITAKGNMRFQFGEWCFRLQPFSTSYLEFVESTDVNVPIRELTRLLIERGVFFAKESFDGFGPKF